MVETKLCRLSALRKLLCKIIGGSRVQTAIFALLTESETEYLINRKMDWEDTGADSGTEADTETSTDDATSTNVEPKLHSTVQPEPQIRVRGGRADGGGRSTIDSYVITTEKQKEEEHSI